MMSDIKAQAKSSRNTKLHALGGKGSVGKSYDTGAGHTFNGEAGLNSDHIQDEQRIKTRKDGGRVGGTPMKPRLDRKARADGGKVGEDWRHLKADRSGNLRDADKISPNWRKLSADPQTGKLRDDDFEDSGMKSGGRTKKASGGSTGSASGGSSGSAGNGKFSGFSRSGTGPDEPNEDGQDTATPRSKRASGGKVSGKGKTNITIVMAPGGQGGSQAPQAVPVPRPIPVPIQAPPPGAAPPMGAGAPPMPMPPPAAAGPMGRKKGGRVTVGKGLGLTAGAGGGEGRLEKIKVQKRTYP